MLLIVKLTNKQKTSRRALRDLLENLGIKSAAGAFYDMFEALEEAADAVRNNFGRPDTFYVSPKTLNDYRKAFRVPQDPGDVEEP